ncbi:uncharacterized protein METZ01_LOCUS350925, partial [marine metagenome]
DIDGLIKNADKIKQEKRKNIIKNSENDIRVSLELVKLDHNVNLTLPISKIKSFSELNTSKDSINKFLNDQGFKAIQQRLDNNSLINKNIVNDQNKKNEVVKKFQTINKIDDFKIIISEIKKIGFVAIDVETNSLAIEKAKLVGISLCYDETNAFYLPINHKDIETNKKLNNQLDENTVLEKIREICLNPAILKIGQNIKYDIRILNKYGVEFQSFEDTMLMSYSLDNGLTRHGMDDLAYRHFSHSTIKFKDIVGTGKKQITFDQVTINEATKYAAEDALITLKLYNYLQPRVVIEKSSIVFNKIDRPLIEVLCSMEEKGI